MTDRVQWCEEPDGFRYLHVDYRDADEVARYEVFRASADALAENPGMRSLVEIGEMAHDPMWFKAVKDTSREFARLGPWMAVLCSTRESAARTKMLGYLAGNDAAQPFDDAAEALAWLREG